MDTQSIDAIGLANRALLRVAACSYEGYLACGGMDERIRVFNIAENKSMGELSMHSGAVTCLEFFEDSYLISGSEDSTVCIWRCHDWSCVHVLAGHKATVNSISVHPSGKLALSVSKDNTMKMWNLVHGRCAFTRRLKGPADKVMWHPSGEYYMLVVGTEVQLYQASDNLCLATVKHRSRVNQAVFTVCRALPATSTSTSTSTAADADATSLMRIAAVCEDKTLHFYDLTGKETARVDVSALEGRPRDIWSAPFTDLSTSTSTSTSTIVNEDIREALLEEGDTLSIVTSLGRLTVLSSRVIEQYGVRDDVDGYSNTGGSNSSESVNDGSTNVEGRTGDVVGSGVVVKDDITSVNGNNSQSMTSTTTAATTITTTAASSAQVIEEATLAATEIKMEPRLTAVVAWSNYSWNQKTTGAKRKRNAERMEEEEEEDDSDVDSDSELEKEEDNQELEEEKEKEEEAAALREDARNIKKQQQKWGKDKKEKDNKGKDSKGKEKGTGKDGKDAKSGNKFKSPQQGDKKYSSSSSPAAGGSKSVKFTDSKGGSERGSGKKTGGGAGGNKYAKGKGGSGSSRGGNGASAVGIGRSPENSNKKKHSVIRAAVVSSGGSSKGGRNRKSGGGGGGGGGGKRARK